MGVLHVCDDNCNNFYCIKSNPLFGFILKIKNTCCTFINMYATREELTYIRKTHICLRNNLFIIINWGRGSLFGIHILEKWF